jgi:RsiW-degrading membrane proteinase PrsW (M82 family)
MAAAPAPAVQTVQTNGGTQAIPIVPYPSAPPGIPPPGMTPMVYQSYPGGPQQVYYVPAAAAHQHSPGSLLDALRSRIRSLASTDALEGFSLGQTFSETFTRHGSEAVEEYMMVGSSKTTPSIETVETGWPKPWMFFRLLALFAIASVVLYIIWILTSQPGMFPAILFMGSFAVPATVVMFIFEMNTPRNVSLVMVGQLFLIGGLAGLCMALLEYQISLISSLPGPVEETAKLAAVLLVARSLRYKYELNGILFGCAVGAGFACFETCAYALGFLGSGGFLSVNVLPELSKASVDMANASSQAGFLYAQKELQQAYSDALTAMISSLKSRGLLSPFGHPVWTAISAGALWRVKKDKPINLSMLMDTRFLKAFAIPVVLHSLWDVTVTFPHLFSPTTQAEANTDQYFIYGLYAILAVIAWDVLFGLIQQGLRQVKEEQKEHLQTTLANVEAAMASPAGGTA